MATRRSFLSASATLAAASAISPHLGAQQPGSNSGLLRVGLVGCGGRGTGAAEQALKADSNTRLVAMADAFADKLDSSVRRLQQNREIADQLDVPEARRFVGFDAAARMMPHVDVVLLCTPPGFRPHHIQLAVEAGKHIFAEKPIAVDAPGVRRVLQLCEDARRRNLSIVSGLCLRYSNQYREMMTRLHRGDIGDIVSIQANDLRGTIWVNARQQGWSDMEWQMRNWYYFTWLSGDFNVEQHVHNLDVCSWVMNGQYPIKAVGTGGRQVRSGPEFGHIYDHFAIFYEYANGVRLFAQTRQQASCANDISVQVMGSRGKANIRERQMQIEGANPWRERGEGNNFYQTEHDELFASIRNGRPINNGEYMCKSTMMAILGRMAAYTGRVITWEQAMNSREDLTPPRLEWGQIETPRVAMPGVTQFV